MLNHVNHTKTYNFRKKRTREISYVLYPLEDKQNHFLKLLTLKTFKLINEIPRTLIYKTVTKVQKQLPEYFL